MLRHQPCSSRRLLQSSDGRIPGIPPADPPAGVSSDVVVILAALLCALICVVGLAAVARCARSRRNANHSNANPSTTSSSPAHSASIFGGGGHNHAAATTTGASGASVTTASKGLKKKALRALPKLAYADAVAAAAAARGAVAGDEEEEGKDGILAECAICLSEFGAAAGGLGFRAILPQVRKEKRGGVSNQYYSLTCVAARVSTPTPSEQPLPAPFFSGPLSRRPGRSPVPASAACLDEMEVAAAAAAASTPRHKVKKQINLFYCAECEELALKIAAASDAIQLQSINWRNFPDGFPNLFINNAHDIRGQHVAFLASFSSPAVIFEQISVIFALPKLFIASFTLVLPFFPTGSFERVEEEGDVATAFTLARVLSMIPKSRGGPTSVVIYDIHALQERFYFGDDVLPCFETGIPLLLQRLSQLPDADNITIAFPDDGAWKRFHKSLVNFPMVVCAKVREGDKRIVRIKEGNPEGRHVVIVDDLVQSGGTLRECQKVLAAHGAAKVSAYVTHAVFPNKSYERFMTANSAGPGDQFAYFWITDSCPQTIKAINQEPPFEVLSLASSIADALQI